MSVSKKVLFVATIDQHIIRFHLPYLKWFQDQGFEVHVAAKGNYEIAGCDIKYDVPFARSPISKQNYHAYKSLKTIIDKNQYRIVHCHTPMGSVVTRLAARSARKQGTKVLYTAHGFHFFKGAPLKNWLLYYPVEKWLSKFTDAIITINSEDYNLAIRKKFRANNVFKINGIGVNDSKFKRISEDEKLILRIQNGYDENDFILIYPAEFILRKNHKFILDSINNINQRIPQLKILFAGRGVLLESIRKYTKEIHVEKQVDILGFRADIAELIAMSDVGISASRQEGLGLNLVEEMFCGLPVVATIDRGHKEMVEHGINGFLFEQNNHQQFEEFLLKLFEKKALRCEFGEQAFKITQKFSLKNSLKSMAEIYQKYI